jgi:hypothetical protein
VSTRIRALAAVATVLILLAGCGSDGPDPAPAPSPSPDLTRPPEAVAVHRGPFAAGPVAAPGSGALLGAWIRPAELTQEGRLDAVDQVERNFGRPFDLLTTYRRFEQPVGTESDLEFHRRGSTLMVSWATGDTRSIVDGQHDDLIRAQARAVRRFGAPLLLRVRWEMDRPNLRAEMWSGPDFVAAWKHIRRIFAAEQVHNVSWVWCPTAEGFVRGDAPEFYPGDDQVDWTCVDVYAGNEFKPIGELMGPFLRWAAQRRKPIVIGEFGVASVWGTAARARWLRDAMRTFKANPQIKAVAYFESDPERNKPNQHFALADDPGAFQVYRSLVRDRYFGPHRPEGSAARRQ